MKSAKIENALPLRGIYTALATPFDAHGEVDYGSLTKILEQQVRLGIRGFVVSGTTGESPTLSTEEKEKLFRFVHAFAQGKKIDLIAGTGTNDTRESIALTRLAEKIGYRRFLVVVPYYNKPSQAGLQKHFETIVESCGGEVILYNVPGRTGISLSVETIANLAAHPRIVGIKEASGNLAFLSELRSELAARNQEFVLLSGDDATYFPFLCAGGHGVISVASHVCPTAMLEIEKAVLIADLSTANTIQDRMLPIFRDLFIEANPVPLKWMLERLGLCRNELRLPLVSMQKPSVARLETILKGYRMEDGEFRK